MKDFKYFVIFGISLIAFIYVVIFMPSIKLVEDHSDELWFSSAEDWTEFFINGVSGMEKIEQQYKGNILFSDLKMQLDITIGKLQELTSIYDDSEQTYNTNKLSFYEDFGITNYIEYSMLCDSMKEIFDNSSKAKVLSAKLSNDTVIDNANGIIFDVQILYTSGEIQTILVTFYNEEQSPLQSDVSANILPTILKVLPKVEG